MILDKHWWRTDDDRLVPDGDPDARILAYPRYTEIPDATAARLGITNDDTSDSGKATAPGANKARSRQADK